MDLSWRAIFFRSGTAWGETSNACLSLLPAAHLIVLPLTMSHHDNRWSATPAGGFFILRLRYGRLPGCVHAGEILCTVKHGDDLQEMLVANAINDAVAAKDDFANRIFMAGFRYGAATARHGGQPLDGVDQAFGELTRIERRVLRDVIAQLRQLTLG